MAKKPTRDLVIGALLVALGILIAIGRVSLGWLVVLAGLAAILLGIFMLSQRRRESPSVALILVAVGLLVVASDLVKGTLTTVLNVGVGVALVIGGILKVESKW